MKCPVCRSYDLMLQDLHQGLKGYSCTQCNGNWVKYSDYDDWSRNTNDESINQEKLEEYLPEYDTKKVTMCPDCGKILIKYKVAKNIPFSVDHCENCNGVWLDKDEWDTLIQNNLHHHMMRFFTEPWQHKIKLEMSVAKFEEIYKNRFGNDYDKILEIREWIRSNPKKDHIIAFITDENPFKL